MLFQKTERVKLMHKDVAVLTGEYDSRRHEFRKVNEILRLDQLPTGVLLDGPDSVNLVSLNGWFQWRGIPKYRVDLERLKERLHISDEKELLELEYGLSVSDHYWFAGIDDTKSYAELNFFNRDFDQDGFGQAMFRTSRYEPKDTALHTPNNTLCGYHRKAWMRNEHGLCLYKGSTGFHQQECINEWLASVLADRLGLYCVPYDVLRYEGQLVSVCPNFLNLDLELATASDAIAAMHEKLPHTVDSFLAAMEVHSIADARASLEEMFLLDYLMLNTDRHGQNAGILVDANTNRWISMAPIFDTGTGLGCFAKTSELETLGNQKNYRLFSQKHLSFESLLDRIQNWNRYDFSTLDDMPDLFRSVLLSYRSTTGISDERIEALCALLQSRIERVKQYQLTKTI